MFRRRISVFAGGLLAVATFGCDDEHAASQSDASSPSMDSAVPHMPEGGRPSKSDAGPKHTDAGPSRPPPGPDARVLDTGTPGLAPCSGDPPVMKALDTTTNTEFDPDWSCYDTPDGGAPPDADAGDASTRTVTIGLAPLPPALVGTPTLDVFLGTSTLGTPDLTRTFDTGTVSIPLPVGVDHVSLLLRQFKTPSFTVAENHEYGVPVINGLVEGFIILKESVNLAIGSALSGGQADPAKALLMSAARDCAGHPVSGAQFELIDGETGKPVPTGTGPDLPFPSYARFAIPTPGCTFTTAEQFEASWMVVNAPVSVVGGVNTHHYRVRFMGRRTASETVPVVLREREVELFSGAVTSVRLDR